MTDSAPTTNLDSPNWTSRLSHLSGVALLVGMAALFSLYLWTSRESPGAQPIHRVTLRPPVHAAGSGIEVVPYQQKIAVPEPACAALDPGQLCVIIESRTPTATAFT